LAKEHKNINEEIKIKGISKIILRLFKILREKLKYTEKASKNKLES